MSTDDLLARDAEARLREWLAAVARVPPEAFTPVESFEQIPGAARADSWFWCDSIFTDELNPHNEALEPRHAFHLATDDTPDLLRHEYTAGGLDLVITESRNFMLVQIARASVDLLALCGSDRDAALRRLAATMFKGERGRDALPRAAPPDLCEGATFSSNPAVDPALLTCWNDRTECAIQGGCLVFLLYKKPSQRAGYANAQQWFDESFRRG